ncbi:hypothetical protein BpHYR1_035142 [Brachionus plicatilis]|uniref:Uncharacterized protein n=1 Tax=Brachionus plicatilis TaxID=10195 RepID=A0A3M7SEG1_BRAPC|nr:hypothetical protein BpHYR1_035142 [Brachionus plicatilis]
MIRRLLTREAEIKFFFFQITGEFIKIELNLWYRQILNCAIAQAIRFECDLKAICKILAFKLIDDEDLIKNNFLEFLNNIVKYSKSERHISKVEVANNIYMFFSYSISLLFSGISKALSYICKAVRLIRLGSRPRFLMLGVKKAIMQSKFKQGAKS